MLRDDKPEEVFPLFETEHVRCRNPESEVRFTLWEQARVTVNAACSIRIQPRLVAFFHDINTYLLYIHEPVTFLGNRTYISFARSFSPSAIAHEIPNMNFREPMLGTSFS